MVTIAGKKIRLQHLYFPIMKVLGPKANLPRVLIEPDLASVSISALQVDEQVLLWRQSTVGPVRHIEGQLHTSQCRRSKVPLFPTVRPSPCALCTPSVCTAPSMFSLCVHSLCAHSVHCTFSVLPVCRMLLVATSGAGSSQSLGSWAD